MTSNGWLQIAFYFVVLTALVVPLGRFMARVFEGQRMFLSPVFRPVEVVLYRAAGVDATREQHRLTYTIAMLLFNAAGLCWCTPCNASRRCCRSTLQACPRSRRTSPSIPPSVSRATPTGRATAARAR